MQTVCSGSKGSSGPLLERGGEGEMSPQGGEREIHYSSSLHPFSRAERQIQERMNLNYSLAFPRALPLSATSLVFSGAC